MECLTLKQLAEELHKRKCAQYPNMPAHAVPKTTFSDRTANGFAKAIIAYLQDYCGYMAYRQSTEGRYRPGKVVVDVVGRQRTLKGRYIPAAKKGLGDVTAVLKGGKFVSIEIKIGRDRQREDQKTFEKQVTKVGGVYLLVRNWNEFLQGVKPYI